MENLAEILENTPESIKQLSIALANGEVVSFPTETVYGLGANALNEEAVLKIFEYKGRPLSDPVIVHVDTSEKAIELFDVSEEEAGLIKFLASHFWPGPLSMIFKAAPHISPKLTANSGFLAVRIPNNEIALALLKESGLPVGAPSANKFCHVSPVSAQHVYNDFKEFPVKIIDGGYCEYRMESTVVKFDTLEKRFFVMRKGSLSLTKIQKVLSESSEYADWKGEYLVKVIESESENTEAPGNFIKHYSPYLDTFIYDEKVDDSISDISKAIFLDYDGFFKSKFGDITVIELAKVADSREAMDNFYKSLRESEEFEGYKYCILPDLSAMLESNLDEFETLVDRVSRAASGRRIKIKV